MAFRNWDIVVGTGSRDQVGLPDLAPSAVVDLVVALLFNAIKMVGAKVKDGC